MSTESQNDLPPAGNGRLFDEFAWPSYEEWRQVVEQHLKGAPFEKKLITRTYEGIDIQPLYGPEDEQDWPHLDSMPGFPPYSRGTTALGHANRPWGVSQELPYRTPAEFNWAIRHDLERGQNIINLVLDKATLFGQDPDEASVGDVGRGGVSIATVDDLATALNKIDLEQVPVFMQASSAALPMTALLMALVRRQGKSTKKLRGCIGMDSLQTLVTEGEFPRSLKGAYDRMAHLTIWAKKYAPQMHTVNVHSQPYHNGGGNAVQEVAFVLATAAEYLRQLLSRGLLIEDIAPRICFSFCVGANFFLEVAKLRAARLLWAKIVATCGGDESAQKMSIHVRTSSWNKTIFDPYVNMLRTTVEAFAGAIGGCDSMHIGVFDEPLGLPDAFSRRIARNSHLILQHESHINKIVDPAGGSWYVETLTDALARKAWLLFQEVERRDGMGQAVLAGFPQAQVAESAAQRALNIARRKDVFVGTNMFPNLEEKPLDVPQVDYEDLYRRRANYVIQHRTSLDNTTNTIVLYKLVEVLNAQWEDTIEAAIEAAIAGATLGELAKTLRTGDETITTVEPIRPQRGTEAFESLRVASEVFAARNGARPQIFLANIGPVPPYKARVDFTIDFFQVGGFEVLSNEGFATVRQAARAAIESNVPAMVICGPDEIYPQTVPRLVRTIKRSCPEAIILLAGRPAADQLAAYHKAGLDDYIYLGANVYDKLLNLQHLLGIV